MLTHACCWGFTRCQALYWGFPTHDQHTLWGDSHSGPTLSKWPAPSSEAALRHHEHYLYLWCRFQCGGLAGMCVPATSTWITLEFSLSRSLPTQWGESGFWATEPLRVNTRNVLGRGQRWGAWRLGVSCCHGPGLEPLWGLCTCPEPQVSPQRAAQCHSERHHSQVTLSARLMRLWTHTADFTMFLFTNTNKRGLHYAQSGVTKCHEVRRTLGVYWGNNKTLTQTSGHWDGVQAAST